MKTIAITPAHKKLRDAIIEVIRVEAAEMPAQDILAVVSVLVGQLIAMQDQRRFTTQAVMALVNENIQLGNRAAVENLLNAQVGGRA